jgi:four helix bundle protein
LVSVGTFQNFEETEVWRKARELSRIVYRVSSIGPFAREYGLRDQIRRASVSVMSNIAEGFEREGTREFLQFLSMAKGSAGETRSSLYIAFDQGYIDEIVFVEI